MIDDKLVGRNSWVEQLDPRLKLILVILASFIIASGQRLFMLGQALLLGGVLVVSVKLRWQKVVKRLLVVNSFLLFIWLILPFSLAGVELFRFGPLVASQAGVRSALRITLRTNSILLIIISFLSTISMVTLIHTLTYFQVPQKLIYLLFFVHRYLQVIRKEYQKLYNSVLLRGFKAEARLHVYKTYAYLIGMLLIKSYDRAQEVHEAMLCRGFKGQLHLQDNLRFSRFDLIMALISLVLGGWLIIIDKGGWI